MTLLFSFAPKKKKNQPQDKMTSSLSSSYIKLKSQRLRKPGFVELVSVCIDEDGNIKD